MRHRLLPAMAALAVLAGCSNSAPPTFPDVTTSPIDTATDSTAADPGIPVTAVTYKITSNGTRALITYMDQGSIEQASDAKVPWTWVVADPGQTAIISGQDSDGTLITCTILDASGAVLSTHTASGAYAIVSCQH